jgi:hypothetical protein
MILLNINLIKQLTGKLIKYWFEWKTSQAKAIEFWKMNKSTLHVYL